MKVNPDSFSAKLILNAIDKLVFMLLLMLILAIWTNYQDERERAEVRVEEVTGVLVDELSELVLQCISSIQHLLMKESSMDLTKGEAAELKSLIFDIELKAELIRIYSRGTTKCFARKLGSTAGKIDDAVFKDSADFDHLFSLRNELFESYARLSNSMVNEITAFADGTLEEGCDLVAAGTAPPG